MIQAKCNARPVPPTRSPCTLAASPCQCVSLSVAVECTRRRAWFRASSVPDILSGWLCVLQFTIFISIPSVIVMVKTLMTIFSGPPILGGYRACEPCPAETFTASIGSTGPSACKHPCDPGTFSVTGLKPLVFICLIFLVKFYIIQEQIQNMYKLADALTARWTSSNRPLDSSDASSAPQTHSLAPLALGLQRVVKLVSTLLTKGLKCEKFLLPYRQK